MDNTTVATFAQRLSGTAQAILNAPQWIPYALCLLLSYPLFTSSLRYHRLNKLQKKYNYPTRSSMANMTDEEAYQIQRTTAQLEFPFMFIKSLQFALFRVRPYSRSPTLKTNP
jgi:hypothetical protein